MRKPAAGTGKDRGDGSRATAAIRRRDLLGLALGTALAMPHVARSQQDSTLRFVPTPDLSVADPILVASRPTRTHAHLVFDTLYGLDADYTPQPQMVSGHTVENDGTVWTLRLRDGLKFHDGTPVLSRDVIASLRRWAVRDDLGQSLMRATADLCGPDDLTVRVRLARPFPHLPMALSGSTPIVSVIMPERLALTDPYRPVTEMVGSGPFRFIASEFDPGVHVGYQRFSDYLPRPGSVPSFTAGPKIAHVDRVEWRSVGDAATAVAALQRGEVDWLETMDPDQVGMLRRSPGVEVEVMEPTGSIALMRFNQLYPPFDNAAIRRAALGAVNQADIMAAVAGSNRSLWRDRIGLFDPNGALATDAGIEVLAAPRDPAKVRRDLAAAGYAGEAIKVLVVGGNSLIAPISQVGADQLRQAGFNVSEQVADQATQLRRIQNRSPPDQGGWNVFFNILDGVVNFSPATNWNLRGIGRSGPPGWPTSPALESLRSAFLETTDLDSQRRVTRDIQLQLWQDVPYIPLGHWVRQTAHRANIVDLPRGFPTFYGVRKV